MISAPHDRRTEPRVSLARACKVYDPHTRKYIPATTCNVSPGGLLVRLHRSAEIECGARVFVGIPRRRRQSVLDAEELLEGEVVRTMSASGGGETLLALSLAGRDETLPLRLAVAA